MESLIAPLMTKWLKSVNLLGLLACVNRSGIDYGMCSLSAQDMSLYAMHLIRGCLFICRVVHFSAFAASRRNWPYQFIRRMSRYQAAKSKS